MKTLAFAMLASLGVACSDGPDETTDPGEPGQPSDLRDTGGAGDTGSRESGRAALPLPRIRVVTGTPPDLILFREQTSTVWRTPARIDPGTFEFDVHGPYRLVVACDGPGGVTGVAGYAQTPADAREIDYACPSRRFPLRVTGDMLEEGEVFFGGFGRGKSPAPWSFELPAEAGTFDFIAFFGSLTFGLDRVAIRRDLAIAQDLQLGTIDAAQEDTHAMIAARFTPTNLAADETPWANVDLRSGSTHALTSYSYQPEPSWQVGLVPDGMLRATDRQRVFLTATRPAIGDPAQQDIRSIVRDVRTNPSTSVTLMDPLVAVAFTPTADRLTVTWGALPAYDEMDLWRMSFSDDFSRTVIHDQVISRAFVAATGGTPPALDFTDVPGFQPAWRHDPAFFQALGLDVIRGTPEDGARAGVSENLEPSAPTGTGLRAPRLDARSVLELAERTRAALQRARTATQGATTAR